MITGLVMVYAFMEFIYGTRKKDKKALKRAGIAFTVAIVLAVAVLL